MFFFSCLPLFWRSYTSILHLPLLVGIGWIGLYIYIYINRFCFFNHSCNFRVSGEQLLLLLSWWCLRLMDKLRPIFSAIQFELGNLYWAYVFRPKHLAYHRSIHQIDSALVQKLGDHRLEGIFISFRISSGKIPTYTLSTAFRTFSPPGMERYDRERDRDKASFEVRGWTTLMWQGVLDSLFPWAFVSITETLRFFFCEWELFFWDAKVSLVGKQLKQSQDEQFSGWCWFISEVQPFHVFFPNFCAGSQVNQDL